MQQEILIFPDFVLACPFPCYEAKIHITSHAPVLYHVIFHLIQLCAIDMDIM